MSDPLVQVPPDLTPDSLAMELGVAYPGIPDGYVSFKGYLAAERNGLHRLFCDDTFQQWIEVRATDVVARINMPPNERDSRSVMYIKRKAKVITCQVSYAHEVEDRGVELDGGGLPGGPPPWR